MIAGIPNHRIEDIKLINILVKHSGGGTKNEAARQLEEKEEEYPEPNMFGNTPAHGLVIHHAKNIEVSNYKAIAATDARPCFRPVDVERVDFLNIKADRAANTPTFILEDVKAFAVTNCTSLPDAQIPEAGHKEL
jgi:hypothetical protein